MPHRSLGVPIIALAFPSNVSSTVVSIGRDGEVAQWTVPTAQKVRQRFITATGTNAWGSSASGIAVSHAVVSGNGRRIVYSHRQRVICLTEEGGRWHRRQFVGPPARVTSLGASEDGRYIVVAWKGGQVSLIDASSWRIVWDLQKEEAISCASISPDGTLLFLGSTSGPSVRSTAEPKRSRSLKGSVDTLRTALWLPGGDVVAGGFRGQLIRWKMGAGALAERMESTCGVPSVLAYSQESKTLVVGSNGSDELEWWDVEPGRMSRAGGWKGAHVYSLAFSQDGKFLALGSRGFVQVLRVVPPAEREPAFPGPHLEGSE